MGRVVRVREAGKVHAAEVKERGGVVMAACPGRLLDEVRAIWPGSGPGVTCGGLRVDRESERHRSPPES